MKRRSSFLIALPLLIAACSAPGTVSPSVAPAASIPQAEAPSDSPSAAEGPSDAPSDAPTTGPIPSEGLGEFTCDLPVVERETVVGITNYTDVRVGTHDGYDRVVLEFNVGTPEFTLERDEPPFEKEPGGIPVDVEGESVLHLVLRNGTAMTETGESSYDGPFNLDPGFPMLVDLVHGGDFEAQTSWFIGLADEACVRVTLLADPHRIVIDVEQ
jgi:hypothetical protein